MTLHSDTEEASQGSKGTHHTLCGAVSIILNAMSFRGNPSLSVQPNDVVGTTHVENQEGPFCHVCYKENYKKCPL